MSLAEYEDFVYAACHVDEEDPAAHWRSVSTELHGARARSSAACASSASSAPTPTFASASRAAAGSPPTAATTCRTARSSRARSRPRPRARSATRSRPSTTGARSRTSACGSRAAASSHAEAARGDDYLQSLLDMDAGARVLGEVAFGLNYEIDRFTRNILFDEKIGGTMHLALGSGFPQAGGQNTSGLHWDMICDLREDGEVYADGELIWKDGRFLDRARAEVVESGRAWLIPPRAPGARPRRLLDPGAPGRPRLHRHAPAAAPLVRESGPTASSPPAAIRIRARRRRRRGAAPARGQRRAARLGEPAAEAEVERADVRIAIEADVNTRGQHRRRPGAPGASRSGPASPSGDPLRARERRRAALGRHALPDPSGRAGRRHVARRSTRTSSSTRACSTGRSRRGVGGPRTTGSRGSPTRLGERREIRVVGDGTDLTLGVEGRTWVPCDGSENFPDGEVFTGPVETKVDGTIRFTYPGELRGPARRAGSS